MKEKLKPAVQPKTEKEKKSRIPWMFDLEVKDLIQPIILRRVRILQVGVLLTIFSFAGYYVWENFLRAPTGTELVNEMVEAAGGAEAWNNVKSGQFTRTRNLFSETGENLSQKVETFFFQKTKEGVKLMVKSTDKDGKDIIVGEDKDGFWATKADQPADPRITAGDLGMMCDSKFCAPSCASTMAFYRFSMPFKLQDSGVRPDVNDVAEFALLDWNPMKNINMKSKPLVLDVSYKPTVGRDKWRFIVDSETKLIHKIEYYNKSDFGTIRPEETNWSDHRTVSGITFSHKWIRYWGNGKVMDEVIFSEVDFENKLTEEFFNRPADLDWLSIK
jgi:hypothetical protein